MGALMRAHDWEKTPLGPLESWSTTLKMMVRLLLANSLALMLEMLGHEVSQANDGLEAIEAAKRVQPELIFLTSACHA